MSARRDSATYAGLSDVGRVRTHNEDAVLISPPLFAVADGLGGHQAGEVASTLAIETLVSAAPRRADPKALARAVRSANRAVIDAVREGAGASGMGTTLTAAVVEGTRVAVAQVGDSRAYIFHDGELDRITEDHSVVADLVRQGAITEEESRVHPSRSVITRALGSDPNMYPDTYEVDALEGDRLLLCSDGLTGMLEDRQIADILGTYRDPESAVRGLVDAANAAGGHDNISVVIVDVTDDPSPVDRSRARGRLWASVLVWLFAFLAFVAVAVFGTYRYATSRAFVVAEEGVVVLYRGLQGEFAGIELHWLEDRTDIRANALGPVAAARLAQGIPLEDVDAGWELLDEYRSLVEGTGIPDSTNASSTPDATSAP